MSANRKARPRPGGFGSRNAMVEGFVRLRKSRAAAPASETIRPGTTIRATAPSANGARMLTRTSERASIVAEAMAMAAWSVKPAEPSRTRLALSTVTAVEETSEPTAAVRSAPRCWPSQRARMYPAKEMAPVTTTTSHRRCGLSAPNGPIPTFGSKGRMTKTTRTSLSRALMSFSLAKSIARCRASREASRITAAPAPTEASAMCPLVAVAPRPRVSTAAIIDVALTLWSWRMSAA